MYCNHCGASVAEGSKFCPSCGKPMKNAQRKSIEVKEADVAKNKNDKLPAIPRNNKGVRVAIRIFFTILSAIALILTLVIVYAYKKELDLSNFSFTASDNALINFIHEVANKFLAFLTTNQEKLGTSLASYYGASYFCVGGALLAVATFFLSMFDLVKTKGTAKFIAMILFVVNGALSLAIIYLGVKIIGVDIIKFAIEALIGGSAV